MDYSIVDIFKSVEVFLPKTGSSSLSYLEHLKNTFKEYSDRIDAVNAHDLISTQVKECLPLIIELCNNIIESYGQYVSGNQDKAIQILGDSLDGVSPQIDALSSIEIDYESLQPLFRITEISDNEKKPVMRGRLFHLPFELQDRAESMRFSEAGVPSLYLGTSSYCCWKELGSKPHTRLWISRYELAKGQTLRILDLGYTPSNISELIRPYYLHNYTKTTEMIISYAILWPLLNACLTPKDELADKPEYVIPQILLGYVTKSPRFDGIRYFSSKIENSAEVFRNGMNYVIPTKTIGKIEGYCPKLLNKFKLTDPKALLSFASIGLSMGDYEYCRLIDEELKKERAEHIATPP